MDLQVGSIITGKVTGIAKFGAFIELAPGQSGLVHISEIAGAYVNEVRDHLTEGQQVQVKIVGVDGKKINLSIKAASTAAQDSGAAAPTRTAVSAPAQQVNIPRTPARTYHQPRVQPAATDNELKPSFEDRLKRFMKDSDSKISEIRRSSDRRNGEKRRGK